MTKILNSNNFENECQTVFIYSSNGCCFLLRGWYVYKIEFTAKPIKKVRYDYLEDRSSKAK